MSATKTKPNIMRLPAAIIATQNKSEGKPLRAFHGSQKLRDFYVARIEWHHKSDEIIAGTYGEWREGERHRGCAVGCSIHGSQHSAYETELGMPTVLAKLEDGIFEALYRFDGKQAKAWPLRFIQAAQIGADLTMVWPRFAHWLLVDESNGVLRLAKTDRAKKSITDVAALYAHWIAGDKPAAQEWKAAADAAYAAAAYAADAAYADAADAAAYADAADAATAAAYAAYAYAAYDADDARNKARQQQADKLIELMQAAQ